MRAIIKRFKINPYSSIFLLVILSMAFFVVSILSSFIGNIKNNMKFTEDNKPPNGIMCTFELNVLNESIDINKVLENFDFKYKDSGIIMTGLLANIDSSGPDTYGEVSAEFLGEESKWNYPLIEGRYYTREEILNKDKVMLVGNSYKDKLQEINGKKYVSVFGEKYEVLGIVGDKKGESLWDTRVFIPALSMPKQAKERLGGGRFSLIFYNTKNVVMEEINNFNEQIKKVYPNMQITGMGELETKNELGYAINDERVLVLIAILGYLVCILISINIGRYWIEERRFEIGLRKALGHSDYQIGKLLLQETSFLILIAFILASIVQVIVDLSIGKFLGYSLNLTMMNLIMGSIFIIIGTILTAIIPVVKALKIQPSMVMRE